MIIAQPAGVAGGLKKQILADLPTFVKKEPRLPVLLKRMRDTGAGAFLVTNSDYWYTNVRCDDWVGAITLGSSPLYNPGHHDVPV